MSKTKEEEKNVKLPKLTEFLAGKGVVPNNPVKNYTYVVSFLEDLRLCRSFGWVTVLFVQTSPKLRFNDVFLK